ncbi:MAG: hypothetical protein IT165_06585 [Bryobacterales bacterium]|nr:hypothetical protein [Bryobacterales bacterium]
MQWFDVDKAGLAKLLARRGKEFIIHELVQNAWDEDTTRVDVSLARVHGSRMARLTVEDDNPNGFADLSHAFTLFAESEKKADAGKRGRFNLREKLVLALCDEAEISSTRGTIQFDCAGRRHRRIKRAQGSVFSGTLRMTQEEIDHCEKAIHQLIPPSNITTHFNGVKIGARKPLATAVATLPTEQADSEGFLRRTSRSTTIELHEPEDGETAMLYEMGIPVIPTGDRWHVNVMQKVPLTVDRDNVPPTYLSLVRSIVIENMQRKLTVDDATSTWVRDAVQRHGDKLGGSAIQRLVELRFGEKRVAYDPSDPEANKLAVSRGYTVVHGGNLSRPEWEAVKRTNAILPAGQVTPSPKPFSPDGEPLKVLPEERWTPEIKAVVAYIRRLGPMLVGADVAVRISDDPGWPYLAAYGEGDLTLNFRRLGYKWFRAESLSEINRLLIHELGHHFSGDHLSAEYHDGLCRLGARLAELALAEPSLFRIPDVIREQAIGQGGRCEAVPSSTHERRSATVG